MCMMYNVQCTHAETRNCKRSHCRYSISYSLSKLKTSVEISQPRTNRVLSFLFLYYSVVDIRILYSTYYVYYIVYCMSLDSVSEHILYGMRYNTSFSNAETMEWMKLIHLSRSFFPSFLFFSFSRSPNRVYRVYRVH